MSGASGGDPGRNGRQQCHIIQCYRAWQDVFKLPRPCPVGAQAADPNGQANSITYVLCIAMIWDVFMMSGGSYGDPSGRNKQLSFRIMITHVWDLFRQAVPTSPDPIAVPHQA